MCIVLLGNAVAHLRDYSLNNCISTRKPPKFVTHCVAVVWNRARNVLGGMPVTVSVECQSL